MESGPGNSYMVCWCSNKQHLTPFFLVLTGRGFAFRRKQKIERKYRKLLKKEQKICSPRADQFTDTYPEHLKHLYLAEEERLKKQHKSPNDSVLSEEKLNKAVE